MHRFIQNEKRVIFYTNSVDYFIQNNQTKRSGNKVDREYVGVKELIRGTLKLKMVQQAG